MRVYLLGWGFVAFVCALVCALVCSFGVFICVLEMILLLRQDFLLRICILLDNLARSNSEEKPPA